MAQLSSGQRHSIINGSGSVLNTSPQPLSLYHAEQGDASAEWLTDTRLESDYWVEKVFSSTSNLILYVLLHKNEYHDLELPFFTDVLFKKENNVSKTDHGLGSHSTSM